MKMQKRVKLLITRGGDDDGDSVDSGDSGSNNSDGL